MDLLSQNEIHAYDHISRGYSILVFWRSLSRDLNWPLEMFRNWKICGTKQCLLSWELKWWWCRLTVNGRSAGFYTPTFTERSPNSWRIGFIALTGIVIHCAESCATGRFSSFVNRLIRYVFWLCFQSKLLFHSSMASRSINSSSCYPVRQRISTWRPLTIVLYKLIEKLFRSEADFHDR